MGGTYAENVFLLFSFANLHYIILYSRTPLRRRTRTKYPQDNNMNVFYIIDYIRRNTMPVMMTIGTVDK